MNNPLTMINAIDKLKIRRSANKILFRSEAVAFSLMLFIFNNTKSVRKEEIYYFLSLCRTRSNKIIENFHIGASYYFLSLLAKDDDRCLS